jgi:Zn-dependent protease
MLADPNATPFDLRFRLFGVPVRVHPMFWLVSALLGWRMPGLLSYNGLGDVAVWIVCAFLSILLHEFGHVWMAQAFGGRGQSISLYSMGGLAYNATAPSRWQRILILLAGPGIQLMLFAVLLGLDLAGVLDYRLTRQAAGEMPLGQLILRVALLDLLIMNLFWPILNLLPIWPLDGGQVTREVATGISPSRGVQVSLWLSVIVAAVLAVNAIMPYLNQRPFIPYVGGFFVGTFLAIFFALFAVSSFQALQTARVGQRRYWDEDDDEVPWRRPRR